MEILPQTVAEKRPLDRFRRVTKFPSFFSAWKDAKINRRFSMAAS